jgi:hypothetical protein
LAKLYLEVLRCSEMFRPKHRKKWWWNAFFDGDYTPVPGV